MHEILIFIQIFNEKKIHDVWISDTYVIGDFLNDIVSMWCKDSYQYDHFFLLKHSNDILDITKTWQENDIVSGDHLILF